MILDLSDTYLDFAILDPRKRKVLWNGCYQSVCLAFSLATAD